MEKLTAEEARKISNRWKYENVDFILEQIKEAAERGERGLLFYENLSDSVLAQLVFLGYKIPPFRRLENEEICYSIRW